MPLTFCLRTQLSVPLEVGPLTLDLIRQQTADEVARLPVQYGNQQIECGELFEITGSAQADGLQVWQGNLERVKYIGARMQMGTVLVEGNVGMHLGSGLRGGEIDVRGNVDDWAGAEMRGGRIRVAGNAGNLVGAAYRGSRRGMSGGEIFVTGNAGTEIGHTLRRGLIAIAGTCGDAAGTAMIAGSIFVFGGGGQRHGAGMKRGTLLFGEVAAIPPLLPTFRHAGRFQPIFLQLAFRHLQQAGFAIPEACWTASWDRFCGDLLTLGKGECFTSSQ